MTLSDLVCDPSADLSVALLTEIGNKLCFIIQPQNRWKKNKNGTILLPFGGIGGKVEPGESLTSALKRECLEEVGSFCHIISDLTSPIPLIVGEQMTPILPDKSNEPPPVFIIRNSKSEPGRKNYTYVFVYRAQIAPFKKLEPLDNPAIILMEKNLVVKAVKEEVTLKEAIKEGALIKSRIPLSPDFILWPTPTPKGYVEFSSHYKIC